MFYKRKNKFEIDIETHLAMNVDDHKKDVTKDIEETSSSANAAPIMNPSIYKCDICHMDFDRPSSLKIHKSKRHKEDKYCYWTTGQVGKSYQKNIDVISDVEKCSELDYDERKNINKRKKLIQKGIDPDEYDSQPP